MRRSILAFGFALLLGITSAFAADPAGTWAVQGSAGGQPYSGQVTVEATGQTYRLTWQVDGSRYRGIGLLRNDVLIVAYFGDGGGDDSRGVIILREGPNGWQGEWSTLGNTVVYSENWTRGGGNAPPPRQGQQGQPAPGK